MSLALDVGRAGRYRSGAMLDPAELRRILVQAFPGAVVAIEDLTGTHDHYRVSITAEAFRGKSRMQQHRLVYSALGGLMHGPIHALSLVTGPPAETPGG